MNEPNASVIRRRRFCKSLVISNVSMICLFSIAACHFQSEPPANSEPQTLPTETAGTTSPDGEPETLIIDRDRYLDRMHGFWLGQSIGNWTGLVTEMDKIGGTGPHGRFYTRADWNAPDQPAIWSDEPSTISPIIDFVYRGDEDIWGADDDTDIEYLYQQALYQNETSLLSPAQIREIWITHIYDETKPTPYGPDENGFQNFLWVSNQRAHELMLAGVEPPETSAPANNPHWEMIDAQLTTEIFGLYAPGRPDAALEMAYLPIRTTGRGEAALAAEFYVIMHALAAAAPEHVPMQENITIMAEQARLHLPEGSYTAAMFDFVKSNYLHGVAWETTRDQLYEKYQVDQADGYDISSRNLYCNGCFASGINFGASLISLFYGEGDIRETIKIATLCGWDSDNPAATWGGLLGFMLGKDGIEHAFGQSFSTQFNIHRTRKGFPNNGLDNFHNMAKIGRYVTDRAVTDLLGGSVEEEAWVIPTS